MTVAVRPNLILMLLPAPDRHPRRVGLMNASNIGFDKFQKILIRCNYFTDIKREIGAARVPFGQDLVVNDVAEVSAA